MAIASISGSEIQLLSPQEDSMRIPSAKRSTIDDKKNQIEFYFRITVVWKEDTHLGASYARNDDTSVGILSIKGDRAEREMALKYIQALYDTGPEFKDGIVPVPMEMYALVSAAPVLRHIVRESGAHVHVTFYGSAHVYGTEMAVTLAVSLFDYLTSEFERGRGAAALSTAFASVSASSSSPRAAIGGAILAPFVEANETRLDWKAREVHGAEIPHNVEKVIIKWLVDDLCNMGFPTANPLAAPPRTSASPVSGITTALRGATFDTDAAAANGVVHTFDDGTIFIDDDEELDVIVEERTRERRVQILPRSPAASSSLDLPPEYLDSLVSGASSSVQAEKSNSLRRINILQGHSSALATGASGSNFPPPHPLLSNSTLTDLNHQFPLGDPGHSPRPPSNKKPRGFAEHNIDNIGNSKKDPISNNSNKFKSNGYNSTTIHLTESGTPGINNRKVKLKNSNGSGDERENPDDWMKDLTPRQVEEIILDSENIENYSNFANHVRTKKNNNARTHSHSPPHHAQLPPPAPHQLTRSRSDMDTTGISSTATSSPSLDLPAWSLRRVVIDGSNVAMAHGGGNKRFSCRGLSIAVRYFLGRGHHPTTIKIFIPQWRQNRDAHFNNIDDFPLLDNDLKDYILWTPCRKVAGVKMNSYDDRFILQAATENRGVVVSNDKFKDLYGESGGAYREVIKDRLLPYVFMEDIFMPPQDPTGQFGPNLDEFLKITRAEMERFEHARPPGHRGPQALPPPPQQYRSQPIQVPPQPQPQPQPPPQPQPQPHQSRQSHNPRQPTQPTHPTHPSPPQTSGLNFAGADEVPSVQEVLSNDRTKAETKECREELGSLFSANLAQIEEILKNFPAEKDLNVLASHVLSLIV